MLELGTIAAIIIAIAAILGILIQWVKRDKPWRKGQTDLTIRMTTIEGRVENINESIESSKKLIEEHETRDQKDFERIETKIDKLTDLMINIISNGQLAE